MIKIKTLSPEVHYADAPVVNLGLPDIERLKTLMPASARRRTRLCAHDNQENRLHEMFVVYTPSTFVKPNKHMGKAESLHILEGAADFLFFDEVGNVTEVVPLGDYASNRQFYCRIPPGVYHSIVIHTDPIVIHETTPGPFDRTDTIFAPWAPDEGTPAARDYQEFMIKTAREFLERKP